MSCYLRINDVGLKRFENPDEVRTFPTGKFEIVHVGMVLPGTATAACQDGRVQEMRAGDLFYIPPVPHDSWAVGDEPYVSTGGGDDNRGGGSLF